LFNVRDRARGTHESVVVMPRATKGHRPKTRFCWECSRQLRGNAHAVVVGDDGHAHAVHVECEREIIEREGPPPDPRAERATLWQPRPLSPLQKMLTDEVSRSMEKVNST
jgi:hypothetical protein